MDFLGKFILFLFYFCNIFTNDFNSLHMDSSDLDTGLAADKLKEMAATSSERVYDTEDLGPVATIKASLTVIQQLAANLAQKMAECENELAISGQTQSQQQSMESEQITPIVVRANSVRKESEETKILSRYVHLHRRYVIIIRRFFEIIL